MINALIIKRLNMQLTDIKDVQTREKQFDIKAPYNNNNE